MSGILSRPFFAELEGRREAYIPLTREQARHSLERNRAIIAEAARRLGATDA